MIVGFLTFLRRQLTVFFDRLAVDKSDIDLLIVGNGPSTLDLDFDKVISEVQAGTLEVIFVNGFFASDVQIPDISGFNYFYLDKLVVNYLGLSSDDVLRSISDDFQGVDTNFANTMLTYVSQSILDDFASLSTALSRSKTLSFLHPSFESKIDHSLFNDIFILRRSRVLRFLFGRLVQLVLKRDFFNEPFGVNVVGYSIMYGFECKFRNVFVIGHAGKFDFDYIDTNVPWFIDYTHFFSFDCNWIQRNDSFRDFSREYLRSRLREFSLPKFFAKRVFFLGKSHQHFALIASREMNFRFLKD